MNKLASGKGDRWSFFSRFDIPDRHNPEVTYLRRWYIVQTPLFGILVHRILQPDSDYHLHDHPWSFLSIILKNSYIETKLGKNLEPVSVTRKKFSVGYRKAEDLHTISSLPNGAPWTLLFVGRRRRQWGFATEDGWVQWDEYFERF